MVNEQARPRASQSEADGRGRGGEGGREGWGGRGPRLVGPDGEGSGGGSHHQRPLPMSTDQTRQGTELRLPLLGSPLCPLLRCKGQDQSGGKESDGNTEPDGKMK